MKKIIYIFMSLAALFSVAGCDDFLDKQPQSSVTPSSYFKAEADLAAYSINLYAFTSIGPGSYGISTFGSDNGTDNQAPLITPLSGFPESGGCRPPRECGTSLR